MKKSPLLYFIFTVLPVILTAQNIQIRVVDSLTAKPLPFANLYFKAVAIGAGTDLNGYASFAKAKLKNPDTLLVSYVGYTAKAIPISGHKQDLIIRLALASANLTEVVITSKRPLKPEKIVKNAIRYSDENYRIRDMILEAMYREKVYENDRCIQLNDAIAKVYYTGYPKPRLDSKIWKSWYYDDRYAFDLEGDYFFRQLLTDFNTTDDRQEIVVSRISDDQSRYAMNITLIGDPLLLLAFDKIKYRFDFLNPHLLNRYNFQTEGVESYKNQTCYVISFYPKPSGKKFSIDLSKKNKNAIYIGRMYIEVSSFALVEFEYKLAVDRDFGFFARRIPLDYTVKVGYAKNGSKWSINSVFQTETKSIKRNGTQVLYRAEKSFQVMHLDTADVRPIPDTLEFKSTAFSVLRYYSNHYNAAYWDTVPIPKKYLPTAADVKDLGGRDSLQNQFSGNGHPERKNLPQPVAPRHAFTYHYPDTLISDSLHWMSMPAYQADFEAYLDKENKYTKNYLLPDRRYQRKLFDALNTFYKKPVEPKTMYRKYSFGEDSLDQSMYYFQKDSASPKIPIFDFDTFQDRHPKAFITGIVPDPSDSLLLITYGLPGVQGDRAAVFPFGKNQPIDSLSGVYSIAWYDSSQLLTTKNNSVGRSDRLFLHRPGAASDSLIYSEPDPTFDVEVIKKGNTMFFTVQSKTENEIHLIRNTGSALRTSMVKPRINGVMNQFEVVGDTIYLLTNDENSTGKIYRGLLKNPDQWLELTEAPRNIYFADAVPFGEKMLISVFKKSIPGLMVYQPNRNKLRELDTGLGIGQYYLIQQTGKDSIDFYFSSPAVPLTRYQYAVKSKKLVAVHRVREPRDSPKLRYTFVRRLWAKAADGTKIPMTLVGSRLNRSNP